MAKDKVHTVYKTKAGKRVPGVTTVLGVLAKPALIHWAWKLGCQGIDYKKYTDDKASIGTLAHAMILAHLKNEEPDTSDYSQNQISQAENSFLSFLEWEKGKKIEPEILETPIVDEEFEFGGTPDFIGVVDGIRTIMDFKTGSGIYEEMYYQLCAYEIAHFGNNPEKVSQQGIILNIPRSEDESFQVKIFHDFVPGWDVFEACLNIYNLRKEIKI